MADSLYSWDQIRRLHLEPTMRCQAACPMCGRNVRGGRTHDGMDRAELGVADLRAWLPATFLGQLRSTVLCGNFGDPIVAREIVPMVGYLRATAPTMEINLNTNGSAQGPEVWRALARLGVRITFAIDGSTAGSHVRYRRSTRFDAILENAQSFVAAGGDATWDMLVFRHNETEVADARAIARSLGFRRFRLKSTTRFHGPSQAVENAAGERVDTLHPSRLYPPRASGVLSEDLLRSCAIRCQVRDDASVYLAASGHLLPCCYLGALLPRLEDPARRDRPEIASFRDLVERLGGDALSLRHAPLPVIVNRRFGHIARRWAPGADRLHRCAVTCGDHGEPRIDAVSDLSLA